MSFDALVPGPDVVWSPDDPFDDPAALALHAQIHRLVQALWQRLPTEVQAIIACDLRRVELFPTWPQQGVTYGNMSMAAVALRWILMESAVSVAIPGAKSPAQALANAAASELASLSPETMQAIRAIYQQQIARHVHHRW